MSGEPRPRGRPRTFRPEVALAQARDVFWSSGYSGSSLDALAAAMSMNRPSVYGAFGDKLTLYLKTLESYRDDSLAELRARLSPDRPLRDGLADVYATAADLYVAGEGGARGCFLIGTAATEAVPHPEVRALLRDSLRAFEVVVEVRFRLAVEREELPRGTDPAGQARLAMAVLHSLAVRARAGEPRETLDALARSAVDLLCGRRP